MGSASLDLGTLRLKEGSDQFLWSTDVEKVPNKRKTRSLTSAWFDGFRLVRGMKRGIFEEYSRTYSLAVDASAGQRIEDNFTAPSDDQHDRASKSIDETNNSKTRPDIGYDRDQILEAGSAIIQDVASVQRLLVTIREASEALSISRTKVYELLNSGVLASVHIGRSRRIGVRDLEEFLDNATSSP